MPTTALPFGMGLDRYTGVMQVEPASMMDMRNLRTLMGKIQARRGTLEVATLPDEGSEPCSAVTLLQAVRSQSEGLAVGYYGGSREVIVFRIGGDGTNPVRIGKWGELPAGAATPPYFTGAETFGKAFLAHDEANYALRLTTQVYDAPSATVATGVLNDLVEDLDADTPAPMKFRGVDRWSEYLIGWGYGWTGDTDRPEYVRASLPGEPDRFNREHYFIAGDHGSPVTTVKQAGTSLVVLKPTESFRITGTSRLNFGIMPFYSLFGCLGTRLAVSVEGDLIAWGFEGPWRVAGSGEGQDLEQPLALRDDTPFPPDLPAESATRDAFAVYVPGERVVEFHFGERIYALSLSDGGLRWSFRARNGVKAACGALMYSVAFGDRLGAPEGAKPTGGPTNVTANAEGGTATVTWTGSPGGGAVVEIWLAQITDVTGTDESASADPIVNPGFERQLPDVSGTSATIAVPSIGQRYSVALRYRSNNQYAEAYESDDPNDWPATSRVEDFVSKPVAPTLDSALFVRLSATTVAMRIMFTPAMGHEGFEHQLYRDGSMVATAPAGTHAFEDATVAAGQPANYTARAVVHGVESSDSAMLEATVAVRAPGPVTWRPHNRPLSTCRTAESAYFVDWPSSGAGFRYQFRQRGRVHDLTSFSAVFVCSVGDPAVEVRQYREAFGVRDYSAWVTAVREGS